MKTKLFNLLLTLIVIGMVIPTFAVSPNKDKGEKTKSESVKSENKTENLTPIPLPPPPTWNLYIHVLDAAGSCAAQAYCTFYFTIQQADANCKAIDVPFTHVLYDPNQTDYIIPIPSDYTCVYVTITANPACSYLYNTNSCCECKDNNQICRLHICP